MLATIIISTYNWVDALDLTLKQLTHILSSNIEVIIADDGSTIATQKLIIKYQKLIPNLIHLWHEDNGFRKSIILNKAIAQASSKYLIFLDGDCVIFPDFIEQHIKLKEKNYFVAGNRILLSEDFTQQIILMPSLIQKIYKWNLLQWLRARLSNQVNKVLVNLRLDNGWWRYLARNKWQKPKGCNFAVYRQDIIAVNGFNEDFTGWGHEDADLFIRLIRNNIKIKSGKHAIPVLHLWHKTVSRENDYKNKQKLKDIDSHYALNGIDKYLNN